MLSFESVLAIKKGYSSTRQCQEVQLAKLDTISHRKITGKKGILGLEYAKVSIHIVKNNTKNWKQIFPDKELRGQSPYFHIHLSVRDLYIPMIELPILLQEICGPILGIYKSLTDMNVKIGTEAAQFPEKEYINGIFIAVQSVINLFRPAI